MKLRSDFISAFIAFFVFVANFAGTMQELGLMIEAPIEQEETQIAEPSRTSGGGGSSGGESRQNPLTPVDVGEWGLYLPSQILTFRTHQWVNGNGAGQLYFSEINSSPEGVVNTWIDGDYIYIQAKELGKTTVTASVYSKSGYTMSNSVNIEVKIEPNPLYPILQEDIFLYPNDVKGIHKTSWVGGFPVNRMWIERVESSDQGIVDTWIDGDSFYIKAINPGETIVTAHVNTDYTFTISNQVKVTVLEDVYGN